MVFGHPSRRSWSRDELWARVVTGRHSWGSECWRMRVLHSGRVGRVVINWAQLLANEDYYECWIYTLCDVGFQNVETEHLCGTHRDDRYVGESWIRKLGGL
jgi:hypothetical protein